MAHSMEGKISGQVLSPQISGVRLPDATAHFLQRIQAAQLSRALGKVLTDDEVAFLSVTPEELNVIFMLPQSAPSYEGVPLKVEDQPSQVATRPFKVAPVTVARHPLRQALVRINR